MRIEEVMPYLRKGSLVYRQSKPDWCLRREENGLRSFYVTIYDLLADDWVVQHDMFEEKDEKVTTKPI